jgi:hypothetical protein
MTISDLDYPYSIQLVRITEGYSDQSTGEFVAGNESTQDIKGHLQEITAKELQRLPEGEYSIGDRRLYTDAEADIGDIVKITEPDGSITEWIIKAVERKYSLISKHSGISRRAYLLKRKS